MGHWGMGEAVWFSLQRGFCPSLQVPGAGSGLSGLGGLCLAPEHGLCSGICFPQAPPWAWEEGPCWAISFQPQGAPPKHGLSRLPGVTVVPWAQRAHLLMTVGRKLEVMTAAHWCREGKLDKGCRADLPEREPWGWNFTTFIHPNISQHPSAFRQMWTDVLDCHLATTFSVPPLPFL